MAGIGIDFADDAAEMANDMPLTLTYGSDSVTVCAGAVAQTDNVEDEGIFRRRGVEVLAVVADFTTLPALHDTVTLDGTMYQINERTLTADGKAVRFALDRI